MKKNTFIAFLALTLFTLPACDALKKAAAERLVTVTIEEIGQALQQALEQGVTKGVEKLGVHDGYLKSVHKILLPTEAQHVTAKLRNIPGFEKLEDNLIEKINRAAEDAASEAAPIFVSAIRQMTFQDAKQILMGEQNAATNYLHNATFDQLYQKFNPKIVAALDKFGARELYKKAADTYNKIPLVARVNNDLDDYITRQALDGLFKKVEEEEKNIRTNRLARTTQLMRKVFAQQDKR